MTFANILGHEPQKDILRRTIMSERLANAYLFAGPDGVGKRLMALAMARGVFCRNQSGCGTCDQCRKIDHNNHPDLHILEAEGREIKIDQVRELQRQIAYHPFESRCKFALIDNADLLNQAAGNALLKTLEEPPGQAVIILLSSRPDQLLQTIRSRCQTLPFHHLPHRVLKRALADHLRIGENDAHLLAALSQGSFRTALGKDRDLFIEERPRLIKSLTSLQKHSVMPALRFAQELADTKETVQQILEIFQEFFRDLLLLHHGRPADEIANLDLIETARAHAGRLSVSQIIERINAIQDCIYHLKRNLNRQLALEVLVLALAVD